MTTILRALGRGRPPRTRARAFILGVAEFRTDVTTHCGYPLDETYDVGRDLAHRLTLRYFDRDR
jgi:hypothetical protein